MITFLCRIFPNIIIAPDVPGYLWMNSCGLKIQILPKEEMNIIKILDLFLKDLLVQGCTLNTINSYKTSIFVFIHYAGEIEVNEIDYELYSNYVVDLKTRKNYNTKNSY